MSAEQVKSVDSFYVNGTSLQGYVNTTYANLVSLFGQGIGGGDKTTAEWVLKFDDGTIATIYDWKECCTPMGNYQWHVGGNSRKVVAMVQDVLDGVIEIVEEFYEVE